MESKYKQNTKNIWFPDQVEPSYSKDPEKYRIWRDYWKREKDRMINGFTLADGKVHVPGWLYFHTVYWKIKKSKEINGRKFPVIETPNFRDIDWEAAIEFERALDEGKFIELVGSRGFGKSVWQASRAGYYYTLFSNTQVVISGGNSGDIKVVTDKIEEGLTNIHPVLAKRRLKNDWSREVRAGWKEKDKTISTKSSNCQILIRNYEDGNKTMAANGTRPIFHVIDEIGKIPNFISCVKDSDGCWWDTQAGEGISNKPSGLPFFTGTGGDMEVGKEAGEMFFAPGSYNLLEFDDLWENHGKIGWFIPVTKARMDYKFLKSFSGYLNINHPDLDGIQILVSDEEKCMKEWVEPRRLKASKSGNPKTLLKEKAYYPIKPSESFLVLTSNDFNIDAAKAQQSRLRNNGTGGIPVEIFHDGEKLVHKVVLDKHPISEFPVKTQSKDGCVVIYEFPVSDPPFGLYVAGVDPYKQDTAKYSDSLGACYVFKRIHDIAGELYQDIIVAQYVGRPDSINQWHENTRNLIKYYNALTLCENEDMGFIDYMINKGDGHYLHEQPEWLKEIVKNSSVERKKGLHASPPIKAHCRGLLKSYLDEVYHQEKDPKTGSVLKEVTGVTKVFDPMLLEEVIHFNAKTGNYDRIVAASLAVALARHLDPVYSKISNVEEDPRLISYWKGKESGSTILHERYSSSLFRKRNKSRLFL
jgi:hypothetical protein